MYEVIAVIAQLMKMKIKMNMKKMMNMMMIIIITITKQLTTAQLNLGFCFQLRLLLQHLFIITPFPASLHQVAALTPPRAPATNSFAWRQGRNVLRLTCLRASDSPSLRVYIRTAPQLECIAIYIADLFWCFFSWRIKLVGDSIVGIIAKSWELPITKSHKFREFLGNLYGTNQLLNDCHHLVYFLVNSADF